MERCARSFKWLRTGDEEQVVLQPGSSSAGNWRMKTHTLAVALFVVSSRLQEQTPRRPTLRRGCTISLTRHCPRTTTRTDAVILYSEENSDRAVRRQNKRGRSAELIRFSGRWGASTAWSPLWFNPSRKVINPAWLVYSGAGKRTTK